MREHLLGSYHWPGATVASMYTGHPSRRAFNRSNGEQVLFLINFYGNVSERMSIREGQRMEALFLHHLPDDVLSEISAFKWLCDAFNIIPVEDLTLKHRDH